MGNRMDGIFVARWKYVVDQTRGFFDTRDHDTQIVG